MKIVRIVAPVVLCAMAAADAKSQPSDTARTHRGAVVRLFDVMHFRTRTEQQMETRFTTFMRELPELAPYRSIVRDFFREQVDWPALEPELIRAYGEAYAENELREIIAFYESPVGQTWLSKQRVVEAKVAEITQRRLDAAKPELRRRFAEVMLQDPAHIPPPLIPGKRPVPR